MKDIDFTTIKNIPDEVSGFGALAHFLGFSLYIVLFLTLIPVISIDDNFVKDMLEIITSAGFGAILGVAIIFIGCPIFFITRTIMEIIRTKHGRKIFYSTPNIKYINLNNDNIFFKNTCSGYDATIKKNDVETISLTGEIKTITGITKSGTPRSTTYTENVTLTFKTEKEIFVINPHISVKQIKWNASDIIKGELESDILKQLIIFLRNYFNMDIYVNFESDNNPKSKIIATELNSEGF